MIMDPELMEGDVGLFARPFQDKYGQLIEKLFSQITTADDTQLNVRKQSELQENIQRYTDFRTYLKFDLETTDQNGTRQMLSQTLNTKSGGETQTPFYIAVLASFAQLYRVNDTSSFGNTVRLAVFDEAFNKMDSDRIIESVRLLRKMGLQAIICTPPDKVSDIMPIADRTLLVNKDKYRMHILPLWQGDCSVKNQKIILNRLLNKYENSKHLLAPGTSTRRVMLKVEKKDFPEYIYEDAVIRDTYNEAASELEKKHLVQLEWVKGRPVLSAIVLRLDQISQCYAFAERMHPKVRASQIIQLIDGGLKDVAIPWIIAWKVDVCRSAAEQLKIPVFCKTDDTPLQDLLCAFREYSALSGSITMRAFSSKCFSDTKYFERNVRDLFLRIARKYDADLANSCDENELGEREQLAYLGIYARPEVYELAGNCLVRTEQGTICIGAAPYGLALPSTLIDSITAIDLTAIQCITFIENKTNYDEYVVSEKQLGELVIYHGGFLSPQKRKLVTLIAHAVPENTKIQFWADIDMGGFRMFDNLQKLISSVLPMRMSGELVEKFHEHGLMRSKEYLSELEADLKSGRYLLFKDAIEKILSYGVTIEQETFLS